MFKHVKKWSKLAIIFALFGSEYGLAADILVEYGFGYKGRMGSNKYNYYTYKDIRVEYRYYMGRLDLCQAFRKIDGQMEEISYPEEYLKRLGELYGLQEPLRKKKAQEELDRAKEEKRQQEEELRRKFEADTPKEILEIDKAINDIKAPRKLPTDPSRQTETPLAIGSNKAQCCSTM